MDNLKFCGEVAIVGHPNVGKSSLLNAFLKRKTAIVCNKPQTTRDQVRGLYDSEDMQIVFIDTPGYHNPRNELDKHLNAQARHSLKNVNAVILVIDASRGVTNEDILVIQKLREYKVQNVIVAINKVDIAKHIEIENIKQKISQEYEFKGFYEICANDPSSLTELLNSLKPFLEKTTPEYEDGNVDLIEDNFIISEIVREQCLHFLKNEIPYGIAVVVDSKQYLPDINRLVIDVTIVCEKESQKRIIIGKDGSKIREIGTEARKQLLNIYDCSIMLRAFVKVDKNWRDSKIGIEKYGYGK